MIAGGRCIERTVDALDEDAARQQCESRDAHGMDVTVLSVESHARFGWRPRQPKFALGLFLQELSTLLDAGLALIEAIEALRDKAHADKGMYTVLGALVARMREGQPLSRALAAQPAVFPELLVATVEASEGSGQLPMALRRFQHYETRIEQIRKRVSGALVYPGMVMAVGAGILLFMLFFVIPRFSTVFESMAQLPATARVMLWWSGVVGQHGMALAVALAGAAIGMVATLRTRGARQALQRLMWRVPRLKDICHLFVLSRFYRTVGLLLCGGTPLIDALRLSRRILPAAYAARLAQAITQLQAGLPVAGVLDEHGLTTAVAQRLLRVGEQSGSLGEMCEKIAHFHDGTLDRAIETFSKLFEPLLMLGVGAVVGTIVMLLYLPIFELASSIG